MVVTWWLHGGYNGSLRSQLPAAVPHRGAVVVRPRAVTWRLHDGYMAVTSDPSAYSYLLLYRIMMQWWFGRGLYINELMAKKFSLLGCVSMMIAAAVQASHPL